MISAEEQAFLESPSTRDMLQRTVFDNPFIGKMGGKFPSDPQLLFLAMPQREVYFAGGAGGGKTLAVLASALQYVQHPHCRSVVFGDTLADMYKSDRIIDQSHEWLDGKAKWNDKRHHWKFPSGAKLYFEAINSDAAKRNLFGTGYSRIYFEEVHHVKPRHYMFAYRSLRGVGAIPRKIGSNSNPGGTYAKFYLNRFILTSSPERLFIMSRTRDNPGIHNVEEYIAGGAHLDPVTRARMFGNDFFVEDEGTIFRLPSNFERVNHYDGSKVLESVRGWDIAATAPNHSNPDPDHAAGVLLLRFADYMLVADMEFLQGTTGDVDQAMRRCAERDPPGTRIMVEEQPGAAGKWLNEHILHRVLKGYTVQFARPTGHKGDRARPAAAAIHNGKLRFSASHTLDDLLDQVRTFDGGKDGDDDAVDGLVTAYNAFAPESPSGITLPPLDGDISYPFSPVTKGGDNDYDWI